MHTRYKKVPAKYHKILKLTTNTHQKETDFFFKHSYFDHSALFSRRAFFSKLRTSSACQAGEIVEGGECSVTLVEWDWWSECGGKQRAPGRPL